MQDLLGEYRDIRHPRNVGLISVSHGINEFYSIVFPPVIPLLVTDFGITYAQAGLLLTVFFVMYSVFQLPAGLVADRVGKKRLLVLGLAGMAASLVLASAAGSYEALLAAQVLAGVSGSTYHPTGMSLVSDLESGETEGKAMGVFGFGGMLGVAGAPLAVGGVAAVLGWRAALVAAAAVGLVFVVAFQLLFREPDRPDEVDELSTPEADGGREPEQTGDGLVARARDRLAAVLRFRITPPVVVLALLTLFISLQLRALHTFATGFLVDGVGGSTSFANGLFFLMLAASAAASIWVGGLADRLDRRLLGTAAAGVTTLVLGGMFVLTVGDGPPPTALLAGAFALLGFAVYGCSPVKNALISEYATAESSGGLFGVTQTTSALGSAAGPAVFGYVATDVGVGVAFPLVAAVSLLIAAGFLLLARVG